MQGSGAALLLCGLLVAALLAPCVVAGEEPASGATPSEEPAPDTTELKRSEWEGQVEAGAGYDTNANGSTSVQSFLGFPLDPRYVATESPFAQADVSAQHTLNLAADRGFISTLNLSHRLNPQASFADQTIAALGTEGVLQRGASRFSIALGGYASWLHGHADERGANLDLNAAHEADGIETILTLRTTRIENGQAEFRDLEVNRYLAAFSLNRTGLGSHEATVGFALVGGHDSPLRAGSPFGNNRVGAQLSASCGIRARAHAYLELSFLRSDFQSRFFELGRSDDLLSAAAALELDGWPTSGWVLAPQVRYVRNDSTVALFDYDRLEAAIYLRHTL